MKQNYKVFLSETEIVFDLNDQADASHEIELSQQDIMQILDRSLPPSKITINTPDPTKSFEKFKSFFSEIEAAGGVVRNNADGKYLLILRNGVWDLPKGKIDAGETPVVAAIREVEEECGIDGLKINRSIGSTYHGYVFQGQPCLKTTSWYLMDCSDNKTPIGQLEEGITAVRWVDEKEVEQLLEKSFGSIRELWRNFKSYVQDTP